MRTFSVESIAWPDNSAALREQVRALVAKHQSSFDPLRRANCWASVDPAFSRALGEAGLIGMTWPKEYGGHERSPIERYIVLEELLAAGAPVGAHWIADRQTGALLLRFGHEEERRRWVPGMVRGEVFSCIGLSEPNSGSDLASVRSTARRDGDDWIINGQKVWTTNAHISHVMVALVRSVEGSERNSGLSQFVIPLDSPGVTIRPIYDLAGNHDFNEVFFDNVRLSATALLGTEGNGWDQATAELSLERCGPERYLTNQVLFTEFLRAVGPEPSESIRALIGRFGAEIWTLRQMSSAIAARIAQGEDPALEAAIVKDLGNSFEQALPELIQSSIDIDLTANDALSLLLGHLLQISPSFSLRGGTREIIKGIIARGLGLR